MCTFHPCCSGAGLWAVVDGVDPDCGREAFLLPETERFCGLRFLLTCGGCTERLGATGAAFPSPIRCLATL